MACWCQGAPCCWQGAPWQPDSAAHAAARLHAAGTAASWQSCAALHAPQPHQSFPSSRALRTAALADRDGRRAGGSDSRSRPGPPLPMGGQSANGSTASAAGRGGGDRQPARNSNSPDNGVGGSASAAGAAAEQHQDLDSGWDHAWDDIDDDWDEWGGAGTRGAAPADPQPGGRRRRQFSRAESRRGPRDAYLRPMIDREGIRQRLTLRADEGEEELRTEFDINQLESRAAVRFTGAACHMMFLSNRPEAYITLISSFPPRLFAIVSAVLGDAASSDLTVTMTLGVA